MRSRKITIATCCIVIGILTLAVPISVRFMQLVAYARQRAAGAELVESLRGRHPAAVSAKTWDNATGWAITAYYNVCFSEEHVTFDELVRFTHDAKIKLAGDVDLKTVDWVWARLAETGRHGQRYVTRFEPQYRALVYGALSEDPPRQNDVGTRQ